MTYHSNCLPHFSRVFKESPGKIKSQLVGSKVKSSQRQYSALPEELYRQFSLAEIKAATNNFHHDMIIGQGTYGDPIYKGIIDDGTLPVAVKCFYNCPQELIRTEVQFLCQLRHPNLVSLIGFCDEQNNMILLYEYSGKGTLYNHLYGTDHDPLPWQQKLEICIGTARGLHYLHTGAKRAVIHRDIKSSSILLDDEYSCKLSDFSLSKMGPPNMSKAFKRVESIMVGTYGYAAPEYVRQGELTEMYDVFSFEMVLFEVLFGRRPSERTLPKHQQNILDYVNDAVREGTIYQVIDPHLKGRIAPECLKKYLEIASSCVHYEGNERPAMGEVEVTLGLALELQEKADSELEESILGECMYGWDSFLIFKVA